MVNLPSLTLIGLLVIGNVQARPVVFEESQHIVTKRSDAPHNVPLKRINIVRDGEHHLMAFQRHHNEAEKRFARMHGLEPPSTEELRRRSFKRAAQIDEMEGTQHQKRKFFVGALDKDNAINSAGTAGDAFTLLGEPSPTGRINALIGGKGGANATATATRVAIAAPSVTLVTPVTGNNANGFSKAALQAAGGTGPAPLLKNPQTQNAPNTDYIIEGNDIGYLAAMQMGTPAQDFLMLIDTGSADTWVPSTACTQCGTHQQLGTAKSSTFVASTQPWNITYGSGSAAGTLCKDTVSIAGMSVASHTFGVVTQESVQFSDPTVPFDGLAGTAFSTLSNQGVPTIPEALATSGAINSAVMGYALGRVADGTNDGVLTIGGSDASLFDASTTQVLNSNSAAGFWQAASPGTTINGVGAVAQRNMILDTGTTLIFAPAPDALALHQQIPGAASDGQGGFLVPCTTNASMAITFGNVAFSIDPRDLTFLPVNNNDPTGMCISSISAASIAGPNTWLVGDSFLKNVYYQTDVANKQISLSARTTAGVGGGAASSTNSSQQQSGNGTVAVAQASSATATLQASIITVASSPTTTTKATRVAQGKQGAQTKVASAAVAEASVTAVESQTAGEAAVITTVTETLIVTEYVAPSAIGAQQAATTAAAAAKEGNAGGLGDLTSLVGGLGGGDGGLGDLLGGILG